MNQDSFNTNDRYLYIISMHQIEQKLLFYLMFMIVSIVIHLKPLENGFTDNLGDRFHVTFLVFADLFMPTRISYMNDHSISVDQARYETSIVAKYLETATVEVSYLAWSTEMEWSFIYEILVGINKFANTRKVTWNLSPRLSVKPFSNGFRCITIDTIINIR